MPSFGRLGKHSNRSQHALAADSLATGSGSGSGGNSASSAVSGSGSGSARGAAVAGYANANAASTTTPHSALSSSHNTAFSSNESFDSRSQQQQQFPPQQHQQQNHQLLQTQQSQLAPSSPAGQGQQRPPPQLYSSPSAASSTTSANPPPLQQHNPAGAEAGGSPIFDGQQRPHQHQHQHQQQQQHQLQFQNQSDFVDSAGASRSSQQSNRYSNINSQSPYGIATDSADDLNNTLNYGPGSAPLPPQQQQQQPPPQGAAAPEKRSKRGLIKNIFSGSSRASSDHHQQQQSQQQQPQHHHGISIGHSHQQQGYDNTSGLARRPSKRVSNPPTPAIKTTFSHIGSDRSSGPAVTTPQAQAPAQVHQAQQQQGYHPNPSPLQNVDEVEDYYTSHESNVNPPAQNSRVSLNQNTIRQVSGEIDQTVYEDVEYRPQQQQAPPQPHVQVHPQDQQHQQNRYDKGNFEQTSPQNPQQQSLPPPPSQQYPFSNPNSNQQQAQYQQGGDPRILPSHLVPSQHQNPETVSQFSHESPITDSDQRSAHLQSASTSPAVKHSVYIQNQGSTPSLPPIPVQQTTPQPQQQSGMAPPGGGPPVSRRQDSEKSGRGPVEPSAGPPPVYRHSQASMNTMSPLPPVPPQMAGQPPAYRGDRPPPQFEGQVGDQGRNSPQPSTSTTDPPSENDKAFKDLLVKYKNVKRLYFDGKSQIEGLTGQIEHLQNAVANQRMSQSRTVLDDSEYQTRFNRLNGAINNLSFNIRKDWRSVPQWLKDYVSADALKTGKQEMTAIGRAVISLWLVEEIFNKCFHPGLDPVLSQHLKEIELSIRKSAYKMSSQEEFEAFTNKVVSWRMTTLEGLSQQLNSPATVDNRNSLIEKATGNLTARLFQFLNDPPPSGVQGSTSMIVELAVGIANNIPLESRDVGLHYPMPGELVQPHLMEVEKTPLPLLEGQKAEDEVEGEQDEAKDKGATDKPKPVLPQDSNRVRFAGFMALEVRGRQVLAKAPVWTL